MPGRRRELEPESHAGRDLPIGRSAADPAPNGGIQEDVRRRWLPDDPDENGIVRPQPLCALPVDLADNAEPGRHRQLPDQPPGHKRSRIGPINSPAHIQVERRWSKARTEDAGALPILFSYQFEV
jgi:hypothetical protein